MKHAEIHIVANGTLHESLAGEMQEGDFIIGVDRGAYWLLQHGVTPQMAIGDFDSCTKEELIQIKKKIPEVRTYAAEKNFTDTELAIQAAIAQKPRRIVIYGGIGTRIDQTLSVIQLLSVCLKAGISAEIRDERNTVQLTRGRTILKSRGGGYVSILPFTEEIEVTLKGLKYPLDHGQIKFGQTLGVSNEFAGPEAEITVHGGKTAMIVRSRD